VPRRRIVSIVLVVAAVVLAASWFGFSGRQGLTPVEPASPSAEGIDDVYVFIGGFAALIFLSVMVPLALIIGRYRERGLPREAEGPQVRGNVRLELLWTAIPVLIVIAIAGFTLYKAGGIENPANAEGGSSDEPDLRIAVVGQQFYFRYVYENGAVAIDRLRIPVDRLVELEVTAPTWDVIHSYWVPALGGKVDAIPGKTNHLRWLPERTGLFEGKCAELCGIQHTDMVFQVEVLSGDEYDSWVEEAGGADTGDLGEQMFNLVCAKCHFAAPEFAPNIAGSPILGDPEAVRDLVTNGRGRMPPVGRDWSERELDALTEYLQTLVPPEQESESE
jgi:cytochrome c oxidase subunit II